MSDLNKTILIGRLTKDAELRHTQSGTSVSEFSLAVNHSYAKNGEKKEEVSYINCTAWGKTAEIIAQYTAKGHRIGIEGRLKQSSWEDKDGKKRYELKVVVDNFQFLEPKNRDVKHEPEPGLGTETSGKKFEDERPFDEDQIPF